MSKSRSVTYIEPYNAQEWFGSTDQSYAPLGIDDIPQYAQGTQELLVSGGHPYRLLGKSTGDIGGNFLCIRREYRDFTIPMFNRTSNSHTGNAYNYNGSYFASDMDVNDASFPSPLMTSDTDLLAKGTTAIANVIPTNPLSDLLLAIIELKREGIPALVGATTWRDRTLNARNAGKEYLNVEFGWKPLVNDIQSFARVVLNADELSRRYERESGKLLHRKFTFPVEISESSSVDNTGTDVYPVPAIKVGYWAATGEKTTIVTKRWETWFEGAFTYHLPPVGSNARDLAIARKLLGVGLTPELLWNLTPWTWALDWFTNTGDLIHNVSAFLNDGLVMPYGYIMHKTTHEVAIFHRGAVAKLDNTPVEPWQRFTTTVKKRLGATPFGFGIDLGGLTNRQWSILVALGLSRGSSGMKYE